MDVVRNPINLTKNRKLLLGIIFVFISGYGYSQNCNCPPPSACGPCQGGINSLTLRYNGILLPAAIVAMEGGSNVIYNGIVAPGGTISLNGTLPDGRFQGNQVTLVVNLFYNALIETSCGTPVYVNSTYGNFTVMGGSSKDGGPICCSPADMDTTPPTITGCPSSPIILQTDATTCSAIATWVPPTANDNCDVESFTTTHNPDTSFPLGTTTVTYTATDNFNNTATCSFDVIIEDNIPPTLSACPPNLNLTTSPASCTALATWTPPTATDNCSVISVSGSHSPGNFPVGITTIIYEAEDGSGNISTCSFTITVTDITPPVFANCPTNIVVPADAASCGANVTWPALTVTDNCGVDERTNSHNPGDYFAAGTVTTVIYTADDIYGNSSTCQFTVTVNDVTPPVMSNLPVDMSFNATTSCEVIPNWTEPTASDNCAVIYFDSDHAPSDPFPVGITKVTYTARDASNNEAIRSFNVTVNDVTPPTITSCTDLVVDASPSSCNAVVTWDLSITDNCTAQPVIISNHNSGDTFPLGTTLVTYEATDDSENKATCSFTVTVKDVTGPEFDSNLGDITVPSGSTSNGAMVQWSVPDAIDNCGSVTEVLPDHSPGDYFTIGSTQVTYTLKDAHNNSSSYSFLVIVNDVTPPVLHNCPSEILKSVDPGRCYATVTWTPPTAQDNSGAPITPIASSNPGQFPLGITPVEYTATDPSGNVTTCTFNIIVTNSEAPVLSGCPEDIKALANEDGEANVTWEPPTASTSCGEVPLESSHAPGDLFLVGNTTVKYFAANDPTKKILCSFTVTVKYRDLEINPLQVVTPNGDGVNDEWIVSNLENFSQNYVTIFDRWGSVIYRATGYNNSTVVWNGTNTSGTRVPNGTYFYNIRVSYREQHIEENGFIELVEQ